MTFTFQGRGQWTPRRTGVSLRPQVSPEVIRHPCVAPVAEGNSSRDPRQEQVFALNVWSWGRGGARGKVDHVTLASSCDVLGRSTCGTPGERAGQGDKKAGLQKHLGWKRLLPGRKVCTCALATGLRPLAQALRDPRLSVR